MGERVRSEANATKWADGERCKRSVGERVRADAWCGAREVGE